MDLSLSDEQKQLQEGVERFVRDKYAFENRRKIAAAEKGFLPENWAQFAELGWLAIPFSEEDGGIGFGALGTMIVMEQFGKGLVLEPFVPTVVLGGGMIARAGSAAQKEALLAPMIEGKKQFAFAWLERQSRYNLADVSLKATKEGNGWSLSGHKGVVYNAPSADTVIVLARTSGGAREEKGLTLFLVDGKAKGLTRRDYPTQDALRASELTFDKVSIGADAVLGPVDGAFPVVEEAVDRAIVALCAEATGCMDAINAATLEYIKTRKQFGVPIGKFQVLQHRMVDCFTNAQEARSMTLMATLKIDDKDPVVRRKAASGAKVQIGKSGKFCGQSAVQMHGGMGVTDELAVSHYFKRLTMIDLMFGNQQHHLTRYSNLAMAA
jgi:pimeloyl-CoA dehydrogenase small subunit